MGVTIHYSQYLALTYKISSKRQSEIKDIFLNYKFLLTITFYSIIMTLLSLTKSLDNKIYSSLIIIPISFQMLHFYLDFSYGNLALNNRKNVLRHLFTNEEKN